MFLIFPVIGVIALLVAVWAFLFHLLRSQRAELSAEDEDVEAKSEFMSKWRKGRGKGSPGADVQIIRPKQQPSEATKPDKADEVRSA
jgi:hypothetical protein